MKIAQVQFNPWDKAYDFSVNDLDLEKGNDVVVKTDMGMEIGKIINIKEISEEDLKRLRSCDKNCKNCLTESDNEESGEKKPEKNHEIKPILRKISPLDLEKTPSKEEKQKALHYATKVKERLNLPMKIFDVHFSYDGSRMTFAFIADGRVDFRELVKDLTKYFGRSIRLQQIGIRDEAKIMGDFGHCGRELCCRKFLSDLTSITSEYSDLQQCSHRGSDRISGICGRLMCCLDYEKKGYEQLMKNLPPLESEYKINGKKGKIIKHNILKQSFLVFVPAENGESDTVIEVDLKNKK